MVRASSASRIMSNRPFFDGKAFEATLAEFKEKVAKKKIDVPEEVTLKFAQKMKSTAGLKTIAMAVEKGFFDRASAINDPLPPGAKTYLQEVYLEQNYGFYNLSVSENDAPLLKGNLVEDDSIAFLSKHLGIPFDNNKVRVESEEFFLTGEADILYDETVRDNKCPLNWTTFRKKEGLESAYYWQLIAYCLLYNKKHAHLDYVLMPYPDVMIDNYTKYLSNPAARKFVEHQQMIHSMPAKQRIKSYSIDSSVIPKEIAFMKSRLAKAKQYYATLNYEICMKMI
jgi:hypothetical protein